MTHRCVAHTTILITCTVHVYARARREVTFSLAELYMYLQVVRFWEKANYPCVAKVHSLKISVINDQIESS